MQRARDPFGEALCAIRQSIREGRYVHGERLAITELATRLDLSATPVREALARLAGEGLIEDRRGQGYFAWRRDAIDLLELYDLQMVYLTAAVDQVRRAAGPIPAPADMTRDAEALFGEIIRRGASSALIRANRLLADRLAAPRLAEASIFGDLAGELRPLADAESFEALLQAAGEYHARRQSSAASTISILRSLAHAA